MDPYVNPGPENPPFHSNHHPPNNFMEDGQASNFQPYNGIQPDTEAEADVSNPDKSSLTEENNPENSVSSVTFESEEDQSQCSCCSTDSDSDCSSTFQIPGFDSNPVSPDPSRYDLQQVNPSVTSENKSDDCESDLSPEQLEVLRQFILRAESIERWRENRELEKTKAMLEKQNPILPQQEIEDQIVFKPQQVNPIISKPTAGYTVVTERETGNAVVAESKSGNGVVTEPKSGNGVVTEPESGNTVVTESISVNVVVTEPESGNVVVTEPESGNAVVTEPESGNVVVTEPEPEPQNLSAAIPTLKQNPTNQNPNSKQNLPTVGPSLSKAGNTWWTSNRQGPQPVDQFGNAIRYPNQNYPWPPGYTSFCTPPPPPGLLGHRPSLRPKSVSDFGCTHCGRTNHTRVNCRYFQPYWSSNSTHETPYCEFHQTSRHSTSACRARELPHCIFCGYNNHLSSQCNFHHSGS